METSVGTGAGGRVRRGGRRLGLVTALIAVVVLAAYLGFTVVLRSLLDPATLGERLAPRISAALNRPVTIERASIGIFPRPSARLVGIRVENLGEFADLPLATVAEVRLQPRLLPLLRRRVEIDRVGVVGPRVLLRVSKTGLTNFGDFVPESESRPAGDESRPTGPSIGLAIRDFDVTGGRIGYRDLRRGRSIQLDGVQMRGSLSRSTEGRVQVAATVSTDSSRLLLPPVWRREARGLRVGADLRAEAASGFGSVEIGSATLRIGDLRLSVSGRVDSLTAPRRHLDVEITAANARLEDLIAALPDSFRARLAGEVEGALDVHLTARGVLGTDVRPELSGLVTVREVGLRSTSGVPLVTGAEAQATVEGNRLEMTSLGGRVLEGPISATGEVELDSLLPFRVSLRMRPSLEAAWRTRPVEARGTLAPSGRMEIEAELRGRIGRPQATRAFGTAVLDGVEVRGGRLRQPVIVPEGRLVLDGDRARWTGQTVVTGTDTVVTTGELRNLFSGLTGDAAAGQGPFLAASARARRLNLDPLLGSGRSEIGYGRIAFARLGDLMLEGRSPEEHARDRALDRPRSLPVRGEVQLSVDSLIRRPYVLNRLTGRAIIGPDRIDLVDLEFGAYGGRGAASGWVALGTQPVEPFFLTMRLREGNAQEFLSQNSPLGRLVSGTLSLDATVEGGLDSLALPVKTALQGTGSFSVAGGSLAPNPVTGGLARFLGSPDVDSLHFSSWATAFTIREGAIQLSGGRLSGTPLDADVSGAIGFGGALALGLQLRPDSSLARRLAAGRGSMAEAIRSYSAAGLPLELGVRIGGTATDPSFSLDADALKKGARDYADSLAGGTRERGLEDLERRGRDLLRRLGDGGGRDTATGGVARDTIDRDASARDTVPRDPGSR